LDTNNKIKMKNKLMTIAGAAAVFLAVAQTTQATAITGNIGFGGAVDLDTSSANTATEVTTWLNPVAASPSGIFSSYVNQGDAFTMTGATPWSFNSGALPNFWSVGGFTFSLISSSIAAQTGNGFADVNLTGTVSGNGFDTTTFTGSFQVGNPPSGGGPEQFTERLSFASAPDGGTTMMLLGAALTGLGLIKRKLSA
jgi:VPDSG-CTERM motif